MSSPSSPALDHAGQIKTLVEQQGGRWWVAGDELKVYPPSAVAPHLRAKIPELKPALICLVLKDKLTEQSAAIFALEQAGQVDTPEYQTRLAVRDDTLRRYEQLCDALTPDAIMPRAPAGRWTTLLAIDVRGEPTVLGESCIGEKWGSFHKRCLAQRDEAELAHIEIPIREQALKQYPEAMAIWDAGRSA